MGVYIPPSVRTVREDIQSSVVLTGGAVVTALIGTSNGRNSLVQGLLQELGASTTSTFTGLGILGPVALIAQIRSKASGGILYKPVDDFVFDSILQTLNWAGSPALTQPFMLDIVEVSGTSSLASGTTYYYVVTALRDLNETGPVVGETIASNEESFQVSAASKQLVLSWTTVTGAKGYRLYRTVTQGNYSGLALVTTLTGEFSNTHTDTGTAATAGSPPGLAINGRVTAANAAPYDIEPAETLTVLVNGGAPQTVTFNAARASRTGVAGTFPTLFVGGETLSIKIDGEATAQIVTFTVGASSNAQVVAEINATPLIGGYADVSGGEVRINSDSRGTASSVEVVGGTGAATLGLAVGLTAGTGNVANIDAVTAAEVAAQLTAQVTGETAGVNGAGFPFIETATPGLVGSIQVSGGTANGIIGFPTGVVTGNDATAGTALRRPATNGGDFYVDYYYVQFTHFTAKRFTNLGLLINEHGLGSPLSIAGTLAMGTAGRGNAASVLIAMSVPADTLFNYQTALSFLAPRKDIDLICPTTVVAGIGTSLKAHCEDQSTEDKRRECLGIIGVPIGTQVGDEDTVGSVIYTARSIDSRRMIVTYPWPIVDIQDAAGDIVETELDGWATAAAVAGRIAALPDRAEPATMKQVFGIKRLGLELDEQEMNLLGAAGVLVLDEEVGQIVIRDGITTSLENVADQQISINLTDDFLRRTLRQSFRQYRGRKLLGGLLDQIQNLTNRVLSSFVKFQLVAGFDAQTISAVQDPDVLTTVIVRFSYQPVFPARVIEFRYSLDLTPVSLAA